jgi:hypothetical protein
MILCTKFSPFFVASKIIKRINIGINKYFCLGDDFLKVTCKIILVTFRVDVKQVCTYTEWKIFKDISANSTDLVEELTSNN